MARVNVFIVHAAADKESKDKLLSHLSGQKEDGNASFWDRDSISVGSDKTLEIKKELKKADIIVLLLSADFFSSDYCQDSERRAFQLGKTKNVTVVPVMLRHFDLGSKYDGKATIPYRRRPILGSHWGSEDEAFNFVAEIIGDIIEDRIAGKASPHLKPPSVIKKVGRKFKRPTGVLIYLFFLLLLFSVLFLPKRNLPVKIELQVNQVDFQLIENKENGFWSKSIFAKRAKIKNFSNALIPAKSVRLFGRHDQLYEVPESRITLNRLSESIEPYLYLNNVYLSEWNISDSSHIELRMAPGKSLFIAVDGGESQGTFNFNDSLELSTESSTLVLGDSEFKDDLEAVVYSSAGRVHFESQRPVHSISLDSLEESIDATYLSVTGLQFEKDMRNEKGTPMSSILSGEIDINGFDPIIIENAQTSFLKLESIAPLTIQKINVYDNSIELLIISDNIKDVQKGTSLTNLNSEMPTLLEWLTVKYRLELLASILLFLSPFTIFLKQVLDKKS